MSINYSIENFKGEKFTSSVSTGE